MPQRQVPERAGPGANEDAHAGRALRSHEVSGKPRALKLLGETLVFIRANGKVHALFDRCAHRGMVLSQGSCLAEGTSTSLWPSRRVDLDP